jgi:hypothetical protein
VDGIVAAGLIALVGLVGWLILGSVWNGVVATRDPGPPDGRAAFWRPPVIGWVAGTVVVFGGLIAWLALTKSNLEIVYAGVVIYLVLVTSLVLSAGGRRLGDATREAAWKPMGIGSWITVLAVIALGAGLAIFSPGILPWYLGAVAALTLAALLYAAWVALARTRAEFAAERGADSPQTATNAPGRAARGTTDANNT